MPLSTSKPIWIHNLIAITQINHMIIDNYKKYFGETGQNINMSIIG